MSELYILGGGTPTPTPEIEEYVVDTVIQVPGTDAYEYETGATATRLTGATALRATGATASRTTGATESTVSGATASRTTSVTLTASNGQAGFGITAGTTQDAGNNIVLTYWDVEVYDLYETVDVVEEYEVEESYEVEEQYNVTATMPAVAASTKAGTATATRIKQ